MSDSEYEPAWPSWRDNVLTVPEEDATKRREAREEEVVMRRTKVERIMIFKFGSTRTTEKEKGGGST